MTGCVDRLAVMVVVAIFGREDIAAVGGSRDGAHGVVDFFSCRVARTEIGNGSRVMTRRGRRTGGRGRGGGGGG